MPANSTTGPITGLQKPVGGDTGQNAIATTIANAIDLINGWFHPTTGHRHDGTDSRKVRASDQDPTGLTPSQFVRVDAGGTALETAPIPNAALAADVARMALGTNNGHEIWQRGTGPFTTNSAYCADRWQIILAGTDTISVSKDTTHAKTNSKASSGIAFTLGTGAGASRYKQRLVISDGYEWLLGQTISVRLPANVNTANAVRGVVTTDGTGGTSTFSGYHPGDSTYHDLDVVNVTVPTDATYVDYGLTLEASCTAYLDNVMPVEGSVCCNYARLHPDEEWSRCTRYYLLIGNQALYSIQMVGGGALNAGDTIMCPVSFPTMMAVTPAVTTVGTFYTINCGQPSTQGTSQFGTQLYVSLTAGNTRTICYNSATSQYFVFEADP